MKKSRLTVVFENKSLINSTNIFIAMSRIVRLSGGLFIELMTIQKDSDENF